MENLGKPKGKQEKLMGKRENKQNQWKTKRKLGKWRETGKMKENKWKNKENERNTFPNRQTKK